MQHRLVRWVTTGLILWCVPVWAAFTEVGGGTQRATATECTIADTCAQAFPGNVTVGNLIIVGGNTYDSSGATGYTITDTVGTTYSVLTCTTLTASATATPFIGYGIAAASGANTVTVNPTIDASANQIVFAIDEFSGADASPLDVNGGSSTGSSTTPSDSVTTTALNDLVVGLVGFQTSASVTPGGAWTQIGEDQSALDGFNLQFQIATTAQAYTADWTLGSSQAWSACTAAFRESTLLQMLRRRAQW